MTQVPESGAQNLRECILFSLYRLLSDATALRMQTTLMYLEGTVRSPERGAACRLFGCSTCESGSDLAPQETPYSTPKEKNPLSPSEHEHRFSVCVEEWFDPRLIRTGAPHPSPGRIRTASHTGTLEVPDPPNLEQRGCLSHERNCEMIVLAIVHRRERMKMMSLDEQHRRVDAWMLYSSFAGTDDKIRCGALP